MQLEDEVELCRELPAVVRNLPFDDVVYCQAHKSLGPVRERRFLHRVGTAKDLLRRLTILIQSIRMGTEFE